MVEYSSRLQSAMDEKGVKRTWLAEKLGISYVAVKKVLDGRTKAFTAENNSRAAAALGVNPDWLATGEGEMRLDEGKIEASNVTKLSPPKARGVADTLIELQVIVDELSPLLQDAGRTVLRKWLDGNASLSDVVATIEGLQQASASARPADQNRAA